MNVKSGETRPSARLNGVFLGMRWKWLPVFAAPGLAVLLAGFVTGKPVKTGFEKAKEEIVMRQIAHRVLRAAGDSQSQVIQATRISALEYSIPFASRFSFVPDSLVKIIDGVIRENQLPGNYIVNVSDCRLGTVVFGYAILGNNQNNIVPCQGREQPAQQYCISLRFEDSAAAARLPWIITGSIILVAGLLYFIWRNRLSFVGELLPVVTNEPESGPFIPVGRFRFHPDQHLLWLGDAKQLLTAKENNLLRIFAAAPNEVIDRSRLQKEVWEDEGVIVGRSLDVFISRLRKKLEADPAVKLVNVHGKGYKLEV